MVQFDWANLISVLSLLLINGALIKWVWDVSKTQYENLRQEFSRYQDATEKRIKTLETDLLDSNKKATSWFKKFYALCLIVERNKCADKNCGIYNEYVELQKKEGEIK